jgi:hypothetical protein
MTLLLVVLQLEKAILREEQSKDIIFIHKQFRDLVVAMEKIILIKVISEKILLD